MTVTSDMPTWLVVWRVALIGLSATVVTLGVVRVGRYRHFTSSERAAQLSIVVYAMVAIIATGNALYNHRPYTSVSPAATLAGLFALYVFVRKPSRAGDQK